mmetsp:Transcript_40891/g.105424  ORF Transcript_40891/g.105424 Transcript_40891/m.105424 type:complete len:740 (+) Transcript_40891:76-2295(+)
MTICEPTGNSDRGLIFPLTLGERDWSTPLRAVLYGVGMLYFFLGVAMVADIFMGAIEKVTGKRVQTKDVHGRIRTGKLWNETVATLTLMALGSSAPEIFLSIIDICKKKFHFGALGPSTIVGSASFNLLVIIGVCVLAIPSGEVRIIVNRPAFYITAAFSLFAYIWMAAVLTLISPSIVEPWEAIVTLLLLPVLIYVSYKFDRGDADRFVALFHGPIVVEPPQDPPPSYCKFECERLMLRGHSEDKKIEVLVKRTSDLTPELPASVAYRTEDLDAMSGLDFGEMEGRIEFLPGEMQKVLEIRIMEKPLWRCACQFMIILDDPSDNISFDPDDDGGEEQSFLTVSIDMHPTGSSSTWKGRLDHYVGLNMLRKGWSDWVEQTKGLPFVNGSREDQAEAKISDWIMHLISLPWKIMFGWCPPTAFFGGWLAFFVSLVGIAAITAGISDLAELFGCVVSLPDIVTAFTFVAMGTSMPDLFASLKSAQDDAHADASVVNVTGSNSVNVFLGLGVPWTLAALFWKLEGRTEEWEGRYPVVAASMSGAAFVVQAGELAFAVISFCLICVLALVLLHLRRRWLGAELGGPFVTKAATSGCFIFLWVGWVAVVSGQVLRWGQPGADAAEVVVAYSVAFVLAVVASAIPAYLMRQEFARNLLLTSGKGGDSAGDGEDCTAADDNASEGSRSKFVQGDAAPSATSLGKKTSFDFVGVQHGNPGLPKGTRGSCTGNLCGLIYQSVLGGPKH